MPTDDEDDVFIILALVAIILKLKEAENLPRLITREKLCTHARTGKMFLKELLEGSGKALYGIIRMEQHSFYLLCDHFRKKGYLRSSKHLEIEEKMMIFLMMLSMKHTNRSTAGNWQHSASTISRSFHEVLGGMLNFSTEMIVPPKSNAILEGTSGWNRDLLEGPFKGAYGAIDGTLINAVVPKEKQAIYRARGGKDLVQNVMGVCDFNMCFTYVFTGSPGVAHDAKVLNVAVSDPAFDFPLPPTGKYYLCDAAYAHTKGFMTPYRNKRYWLKDYRAGGRARDKEEKFNHAHSQLRNVIERTYGVLKERYPLLKEGMPSYSFETQKHIVVACMTLHNFLRRFAKDDEMFEEFVRDDKPPEPEESDSDEEVERESFQTTPQNQAHAAALRTEISNELDAIW